MTLNPIEMDPQTNAIFLNTKHDTHIYANMRRVIMCSPNICFPGPSSPFLLENYELDFKLASGFCVDVCALKNE